MSTNRSIDTLTRTAAAALVFASLSLTGSVEAEARAGRGFSTGSRGVKTYTAPPATKTAPTTAQPMQRTTQPAAQTAGAATAGAAAAARPASRFGTGFMGGLLGAGLIGALLGAGFFGGIGGILGMVGFLLQAALIAGVVYFAISYFRRRNQPATATPNGPDYQRTAMNESRIGSGRNAGAGMGTAGAAAAAAATQPLVIEAADYTSFERLLSVIQLSYSREDQGALRSATTPEMLGYFTEQLDENARNGVRNDLGQPKLLSGDLAEAWSEATGEYASVAMRYSLTDATVERTSGRVVEGSTSEPQEVTEVWTFTRRHGGGANAWKLSAIQQTA